MSKRVKTIPIDQEPTIEKSLISRVDDRDRNSDNVPEDIVYPDINDIVEHNQETSRTNRDILDIFPDIGIAPKILKAVIINAKPSYTSKTPLPPVVKEELNMLLRETLSERYGIDEELSDILEESLFFKGSSSYLTVPFQELLKITDSVGSKRKSGSTYKRVDNKLTVKTNLKISNESDLSSYLLEANSIFDNTETSTGFNPITITDSLDVFTMASDLEEVLIRESHSGLKTANESDEVFDEELEVMFNNIIKPKTEDGIVIDVSSNHVNEGDGLHMKIDSDLVVPLNLSGDKTRPLGYLIMANENNKILKHGHQDSEYGETDVISSDGSSKELRKEIDRLKKSLSSNRDVPMLEITDEHAYKELINTHITNKIKKSKIGELVEFDRNEQILEIMFKRALEAKETKLIYVPEELLTYYAFEYNDNGTGRSMIDNVSHLISIRAMLTFAKIRSDIENAIPKKVVEIKIDPENRKPEKEMARFINSYNRHFNRSFRWGTSSIRETSEWVQSIGTSYRFQHPQIPYNEISETNVAPNSNTINPEFLSDIRNSIFRRFGLTSSMIDDSSGSDFATLSVLANDLSRKEMSGIQDKLMKHHSTHCQRILRVDRIFNNKLRQLIHKHQSAIVRGFGSDILERIQTLKRTEIQVRDWLVRIITEQTVATLPTLRNEDEDMMRKRFKAYVDMVDETLDMSLFSEESFPKDVLGKDLEQILPLFKSSYRNSLIRSWMIENDYMIEVAELLEVNDGVIDVSHMNEFIGKITKLGEALAPYTKHFKKVGKGGEKLAKKIGELRGVENNGNTAPDSEGGNGSENKVDDGEVDYYTEEPEIDEDKTDENKETDENIGDDKDTNKNSKEVDEDKKTNENENVGDGDVPEVP